MKRLWINLSLVLGISLISLSLLLLKASPESALLHTLGMLVLLAIFLFHLLWQRRLQQRLSLLASHLRQSSRMTDPHGLHPIPRLGNDEVGSLGRDYNALLCKLRECHDNLAGQLRQQREDFIDSEKKCRDILETTYDAYFSVDASGRLSFFTEPLCRLSGYDREQLTDHDFSRLLCPDQPEGAAPLFTIGESNSGAHRLTGLRLKRKDGSICLCDLSVSPIRTTDGTLEGWWGMLRDNSALMII